MPPRGQEEGRALIKRRSRRLIFGYGEGEEVEVQAPTISDPNPVPSSAPLQASPIADSSTTKKLIPPQNSQCASVGQVCVMVALLCGFALAALGVVRPSVFSACSSGVVEVGMELAFWIGELLLFLVSTLTYHC
jgi:hypothetical protein